MFHKLLHKATHGVEPYVHVAYCSAVFIESHGVYGLLAGLLGFVILVSTLLGEG